jgi:membrane-associated phospholipid phosphatase
MKNLAYIYYTKHMSTMLKRFDTRVIIAVQKLPEVYRPFMNTASFAGQPLVTVGLCLAVIGVGLIKANYSLESAGATAIGAIIIGHILKLILRRTRPETDYVRAMRFSTFSFPSGHTLGATMAFGLLAIIANGPFPVINVIAWTIDVAVIGVVGTSRVYLGAHFPSDVVAGWLFGAIGLLAVTFVSGGHL